MTDALTEFDYLLNRVEHASQADSPAEHGYNMHRKALYAYVRDLEQRAAQQAAMWQALCEMVERFEPNAWGSADNRRDALENARAAIAALSATQEKP